MIQNEALNFIKKFIYITGFGLIMIVGSFLKDQKWLVWIVLVACLSSFVSAVYFDVEVDPESQIIGVDEAARFKITVSHDSDFTESFEIYSPDVEWDINAEPSADIYLEVAPKEIKATTLLVRPLYVNPGYYSVGLNIRLSETNNVIKKNLLIGVSKAVQEEYSPAIYARVVAPSDVNPIKEVPIKVQLKNQNRKGIDRLELKIRSEFINKDYVTSLEPLEEKEINFVVKLDPKTPPAQDTIQASLFAPGTAGRVVQFDLPAVPYNIMPYGGIEQSVNTSGGFFSSKKVITLTNVGNAKRQQTYEEKTNLFKRLFTFTEPNARTKRSSDGRFLSWEIKLNADETEQIVIKTDYKLIVYALLLAILALALYFLLRSPLLVKKAAMIIESAEGGISELKIIVSIKNRTRYPLRDLTVFDKIPNIAKLKEEDEVGTLRPSTIKECESDGTLLKWTIRDIDPSEERILSYKIRTKLSVLGGFRLPSALVKYKFFNYNRARVSKVENLFKSR